MGQERKTVGRRQMVKVMGAAGVGLVAATACSAPSNQTTATATPAATPVAAPTVDPAVEDRPNTMTPDEALNALLEGNKRFQGGSAANPRHSYTRVQDTASDEFPFAAILCSPDSRVSPEIVFDQGIGDLYVTRMFGFVATPEVIESLEYAVSTLQVPLIMVMGSDREPAVQAVLRDSSRILANMKSLAPEITPAVEPNKGKTDGSDLSASIKANMKLQADRIAKSEVIAKAIQEGKVKVVTAYYDLDDATVEVES